MSLCFASAGVLKTLQVAAFTLVWTHSVEKVDWQEDWRVAGDGLTLVAARIKGSGAGMEPPPEARLDRGWWRWQPAPVLRKQVVLGHSGAAGEWRVCVDGRCNTLSELLGQAPDPHGTVMSACDAGPKGGE
ncbi:hypothetical protein X566_12280 [Afipia sp. P52-10]|uniref:DUF1850 domain-containing protein n=1 Tax=Afipia sp. P52-10 TaxID=1429916 RepID=UPI0003DF3A84|nr:DUF1850 domain-containing protein [Afipia sp. P52-10]ETR78344.1 hypothetical protein X566_12280 [Afipia sp. P52-10]